MAVKVVELRPGKYGLRICHKGKRQTITIGTKQAAQQAKVRVELSLAQDKLGIGERGKPTFAETGAKYLSVIKMSTAPRTYQRYRGLLNMYINRHLGPLLIDKVTRGDVRDALLQIHADGASRSSVELMHTVISGVFNHAIDDEHVSGNPARGVLKRLGLGNGAKKISPFTDDQMQQVLNKVDRYYRDFFFMLFQTGMRLGELCALQWEDVDLRASTARVSKTSKDQNIRMETKTYLVRDVDLSADLLPMLVSLKAKDKAECFLRGVPQVQVFHKRGKLYSQQTLLRKLQRTCKELGIGHKTIHDIRHTTASILLSRGASITYVSKLLGHSSPRITLDRYSHYMPSENKGMINLLDVGQKGCYKPVRS